MQTFVLVFIVLSTLASTFLLYYLARRWALAGRMEGFEGELPEDEGSAEKDPNVLLSLVARLKRMSGFLVSSANWKDRIEMVNMNPMDRARRHIKSNTKAE